MGGGVCTGVGGWTTPLYKGCCEEALPRGRFPGRLFRLLDRGLPSLVLEEDVESKDEGVGSERLLGPPRNEAIGLRGPSDAVDVACLRSRLTSGADRPMSKMPPRGCGRGRSKLAGSPVEVAAASMLDLEGSV